MSSAPIPPPPREATYGAFVRTIEPDRHVYHTFMNARRWVLAVFGLAGTLGSAWGTHHIVREGPIPFAIFTGVLSLIFPFALLMAFMLDIRLTITSRDISLYRRGFLVGRTGTKTWPADQRAIVMVDPVTIFSKSGNSTVYGVQFGFKDGALEKLGLEFEERALVGSFVTDVMQSLHEVAGPACQPELWLPKAPYS